MATDIKSLFARQLKRQRSSTTLDESEAGSSSERCIHSSSQASPLEPENEVVMEEAEEDPKANSSPEPEVR